MSVEYCLRVIRFQNLQWEPALHRSVPNFYADVKLGEFCRRTRIVKNSSTPLWDDVFVFSSSDIDAIFTIQVWHRPSFSEHKRKNIGFAEVPLGELLTRSANGEVCVELRGSSQVIPTKSRGVIVLHLQTIDIESIKENEMTGDRADVLSGTLETAKLDDQGALHQSLDKLMSRLTVLQTVTDPTSEAIANSAGKVHPFLKLACDRVSDLSKAAKQIGDDEKIIGLIRNLANTVVFIIKLMEFSDEAADLRVEEHIKGFLQHISSCCEFFRKHSDRLSVENYQNIEAFERTISNFKEEIDSAVALYAAHAAHREARRNNVTFLRQRLNPSHMDAFGRPLCLPGSCPEVMHRILDWAISDTKQNIFWLHGNAGCGKSTISTTIADHLREEAHLGAFLFFERGKSNPSSVIRTIAYKLSLFDSSIGSSILAQIEHDKDIASATALRQFNKLLLEPLCAIQEARSSMNPIHRVLGLDIRGSAERRRLPGRIYVRTGLDKLVDV